VAIKTDGKNVNPKDLDWGANKVSKLTEEILLSVEVGHTVAEKENCIRVRKDFNGRLSDVFTSP
jgi:hypothetical protein